MAAILVSRVSRRHRWRSESGAELIEFALAFPLLLLVVLGIIDFGFLFQRYEVVTNAAREGARISTLLDYQGANLNQNVEDRVNTYLDAAGLVSSNAVVSVTPASVSIGGNCMSTYTVTVSYPHEFSFVGGIAAYFGGSFSTATLTATSTMRGEATVSTCS